MSKSLLTNISKTKTSDTRQLQLNGKHYTNTFPSAPTKKKKKNIFFFCYKFVLQTDALGLLFLSESIFQNVFKKYCKTSFLAWFFFLCVVVVDENALGASS